MKKKRGGHRENAGRPTPDGAENVRHKNVMLSDAVIEKAKKIGHGNLSAGIRKAVNEHGSGGKTADKE